MKISVNRETMLAGLQRVQSIIGSNSYIPCLSNVRIEAKNGVLTLLTSNTDISILTTLTATVEIDGSTSIPAKKLVAILKEMEGSTLTLEKGPKEVSTIQCGKSQYKLHGLPITEFPPDPKLQNPDTITFPQSILRSAIRQTIFAASTQEERYILNGALIELLPDTLNVVATDGRRLSLFTSELKNQLTKSVVVPTKSLAEIERLLKDSGDVVLSVADNLIEVKTEEIILTSKIIEGPYPNYKQVIPQDSGTSVELNKDEFMGAVKRVGLLSGDKALKLTFTKDQVLLTTNSPEIGEAKEPIDIKYDGAEVTIAFNPSYLFEALKHTPDEKTSFNLIDAHSPAVLKSPNYLQVLMPMRVE